MEGFEELSPFLLPDVRPTGEKIGSGAYGSVEMVRIPGALCAAKKIHSLYQDRSEIPEEDIRQAAEQFERECRLMTTLRHPHIVQFLGVFISPESPLPMLVMELLSTDLHGLLDGSNSCGGSAQASTPPQSKEGTKVKPFIPLALKVSMLHNVASGLCYLHEHSPPIIHRDLSARNILLTSGMVAKIADLGVARIVSFIRGRASMTKGPGALIYMPPEAIAGHFDRPEVSQYDGTIDIFSFGVVSIFTLSQTFPDTLLPPNYQDGDELKARTELQRREAYMQQIYGTISQGHPLVTLIRGCLQNSQFLRPDISSVLELLDQAKTIISDEQSAMNKLELIQALHHRSPKVQINEISGDSEDEIRHKDVELHQLEEINKDLRMQLEGKQAETSALKERVDSLRQQEVDIVRLKDEEMARIKEEKESLQQQIVQLKTSHDRKMSYLERKLASSEDLVAEFQTNLLLKTKEYEQLAKILDTKQPTPKPRKSVPSKPESALPQKFSPTVSEPRQTINSPSTPFECNNKQSFSSTQLLENKTYTSQTSSEAKLHFNCTRKANAPKFDMMRGSAVADENFAYFTPLGYNSVHRYCHRSDTWSELPKCPYRNIGLVLIDGELVAIGGRKAYSDYSRKLLTLHQDTWIEKDTPPMIIARDSPSLVTVKCGSVTNIVVAGGSVSDSKWTTTVEMYDARMHRWCSLGDLPKPLPYPSAVIRHTPTSGTLLLSVVGCYQDGYYSSLFLTNESLVSTGWAPLPRLPISRSSLAVLQDNLVVVGGWKSSQSVSYVYQLLQNEWIELGTVPNGRECLIASVTSTDQIIMVGGEGSSSVCIYSMT